MIKKGFGVTIIFIVSTFVQLISQIVITRAFGANFDLDVFLAAVALPTIFVTIIYGTLNDAFLPLFGEKKAKSEEEGNAFFFQNLILLTFLSFLIALILNYFSLAISHILYQDRGLVFVKAVSTQMQYMLYSIPLAVIATIFGSYFYTHKQFFRFPLAQFIGSLANLGLIILLAPSLGIWALIIAFVVNILIQIIFIIPGNFSSLDFSKLSLTNMGGLLPILLAWIPLIIGNFAFRSDTLLIRSLGASLPAGSLVYLNLVSKIFSLSTSVMTVGIQVLLLPHLVDYIVNKDYEATIRTTNKAKIIAIGISMIVTILLALFAPFAIQLLFIGNKFTLSDAQITISMIPLFILPAIGWGISSVFFQPLIALKKQPQLAGVQITSLLLGWGAGVLVKNQFGALPGITIGLIVLLFSGIIGSELLWQHYKKSLLQSPSSS